MDYEKKYKNALEKAKSMIDDLRKGEDILAVSDLEEMFPELKESEDERMKNQIINYFECQSRDEPSRKDIHNKWINYIKNKTLSKNDYAFLRDCARILKTFGYCSHANKLFNLCPELGESIKEMMSTPIVSEEIEDEKIRKELLGFIANWKNPNNIGRPHDYPMFTKNEEQCNKYIAWLEKQGENPIYNVPSREVILAIWELGNDWKELTNYCISTEYGTMLDYIQKHWEESEYYLREKKSGQKPVNKIEPKFHEGEWITNGDYTWKIVEVKSLDYTLQSQDGNQGFPYIDCVDRLFRLWAIQDAKNGDVLVVDNIIFIYKRILSSHIVSYCKLINGKFEHFEDARTCCEGNAYVHPATKEQHNTLMKAMADAGYTFDFEKKELKKIENETEIPFGAKDSELQEVTYFIPKGFHAEIDNDKVVIKKGENSTSWSEEDELMVLSIIQSLKLTNGAAQMKIDWLKSLKKRIV